MERHDVFISHASADKDRFVRKLAHTLMDRGYDVWFDELSIRPGDSIRQSIDQGLAKSAAGLVVLSPTFFDRSWPTAELNALLSQNISQKKGIIPIWLDVTYEDVAKVSPILADRKAIIFHGNIESVANLVADLLPTRLLSQQSIQQVVKRLEDAENHELEFLGNAAENRLRAMAAISQAYEAVLFKLFPEDCEDDPEFDQYNAEREMEKWEKAKRREYDIPDGVYFPPEPRLVEDMPWAISILKDWIAGTLDLKEMARFYWWLDESVDLDYPYVLFGLPLRSMSSESQRYVLEQAVRLGTRFEGTAYGNSFDRWWKTGFDAYHGHAWESAEF